MLDAAFSFDIWGAAITTDPIIIALGLGVSGCDVCQSTDICYTRPDTLDRYVYLEHGAHWALARSPYLAVVHRPPIRRPGGHRFGGVSLSGRRSPSVRSTISPFDLRVRIR